ncbi:MAG: nickel/cobalt efflux protein RcnA [Alphaproteobacteria bacterium ADurb.Bin438]|nr:MAG: nickel/cobalt efflux protein RcnA [Alphaproteobacteria bacterium ADurb.Bin438]
MIFKSLFFSLLMVLSFPSYSQSFSLNNKDLVEVSNNEKGGIIHDLKSKFTKLSYKFLKIQKEYNKEISSHIRKIKKGDFSLILSVLGIAFLYGVIHALGPGHGKLVVISYFLSHSQKWFKGIFMGFQIAFMHVISAIFIVLLTSQVAKHMLHENQSQEMYFIKLISYGAIALVGFYMLYQAYKEKQEASSKSMCCLALSAGLIPCAGTLLIMFYSMSLGVLMVGVMISLAIAFGIAFTLSLIGIICVFTNKKMSNFKDEGRHNKFVKSLNYVGAILIIFIGGLLFVVNL